MAKNWTKVMVHLTTLSYSITDLKDSCPGVSMISRPGSLMSKSWNWNRYNKIQSEGVSACFENFVLENVVCWHSDIHRRNWDRRRVKKGAELSLFAASWKPNHSFSSSHLRVGLSGAYILDHLGLFSYGVHRHHSSSDLLCNTTSLPILHVTVTDLQHDD